jgi:hypothetical protein
VPLRSKLQVTCWSNTPVIIAFPLRYVRLTNKLIPSATLDRLEYARKSHSDYIGFARAASAGGQCGYSSRKWLFRSLDEAEAKWSVAEARANRLDTANVRNLQKIPSEKVATSCQAGYAGERAPAFAFPLGTTREEPREKLRGAHKNQTLGLSSTGTPDKLLWVAGNSGHFRISPFPGRALREMQAGVHSSRSPACTATTLLFENPRQSDECLSVGWACAPSCAIPVAHSRCAKCDNKCSSGPQAKARNL